MRNTNKTDGWYLFIYLFFFFIIFSIHWFLWTLKVDVPILPCVFYTFNWLTLTSEMYFVRFHPEVTSCLLSRGKIKYATLGMRLWCKYIKNYLLVYQLISHFLPYLRNYKEFEGEISDLQLEKYGLSFEIKEYTTSGRAWGDENVIGIRAFNMFTIHILRIFNDKNGINIWRVHLQKPTSTISGLIWISHPAKVAFIGFCKIA